MFVELCWTVKGHKWPALGLICVHKIQKGDEITFNYGYTFEHGDSVLVCNCGSDGCVGFVNPLDKRASEELQAEFKKQLQGMNCCATS
jgi:SET domain-containing protein